MPRTPLKITVLGSGTSMGVPTLGCPCRVCHSNDPHDKRLRPSILLSRGGQNVVIDTTPDFRQQAMRAGIDRLDAILLTHGHADHVLGFDDIRPYNVRQRAALPVYSNEETFRIIRRIFAYVFDDKPTLSTVPSVTLNHVEGPFALLGISFVPLPLLHGDMKVLGFRFGRAAYLTDFSAMSDSSMALLEGLDELILDALRDIPHPMHQTVDSALALIEKLKPRRAWFTHIAHDLPHAATNERLAKMGFSHVQLAYDGLQFEVRVDANDEATDSVRTLSPEKRAVANVQPPRFSTFTSAEAWHSRFGKFDQSSVLAIGSFDGIHLGHQAILRSVVARARALNAVPTALTFDPSPRKVLRPEAAPPQISTIAQRIAGFSALGLEAAVVLPFTLELSRLTPEEFVQQILLRNLRIRALFVGENFRFGHKQAGDVNLLRKLGVEHAFEVVVLPPVIYRSEIVSSTLIRKEIGEGNVPHAARLLGRPFVLTGEVVSGTGTGHRFTFPTLNLAPDQSLLPLRGVYVTRTCLEGENLSRRSVTNIGMRPTFNGSALSVETHVLAAGEPAAEDSGLKPGATFVTTPKRMEIRFWERLRDEKKFAGPEELRAQIARDIAAASKFFSRLRRFRSLRNAPLAAPRS
ncbi:MAG TPA: bifunctional riboflavin kinase/FAD synthetase [Candidatus Acidoferrum sp.]|nr:bifunctional riboflavin kinase/FAD synthetase [Candidatus Acidoferrum sp.]